MNQQFWPQISSSFQTSVMQTSGYYLLLIVLLVVLALILFYLYKRKVDQKKQDAAPKYFEVAAREEISEILETALGQNSRFDLRLSSGGRELLCLFREYAKDSILLEPPDQIKSIKRWSGRQVQVYFRISLGRGKFSFYKFKSRVMEALVKDDVRLIRLAVPELLEMEQKRQHLRLELPGSYIRLLEIRPVSHDRNGEYHTSIQRHGQPIWTYEQGSRTDVVLKDISGGGARLDLSPQPIRGQNDFFKDNPVLLLSMIFYQHPGVSDKLKEFHLIGRVRKHYPDTHGNYIAAIQFIRQASFDQEEKVITGWEKVEPNDGVEDLASWVVRTYLKIYREKGLV
ncbi:PilZ domain-containing protein [Desulfonatronovibrio hydrogenovorans]|uniref:PilZ domain-containing protein n=1 Tax=Desulfonatronovibrio hydrogenovorans TaxID=53245 RepID=UPI001378CD03|nr:PilZ domain-containing protein [Desulfonatronovibrio hydrogenovorans]